MGKTKNGRYRVDEYSIEEQEREKIFSAYKRGIKAFIEEYDKQNPDNPLKQINVGWTNNKLKRQLDRFQKSEENLNVPEEYCFEDAAITQKVLYKRKDKANSEIEIGDER